MSERSELHALYAELPKLVCQGKCQASCGPVAMTEMEHRVIKRRLGHRFPPPRSDNVCAQLTAVGRCSLYGDRPLVCRLYGIVESMKCPHGCVPEGGYWTNERARDLFDRLVALSGDSREGLADEAARALKRALENVDQVDS